MILSEVKPKLVGIYDAIHTFGVSVAEIEKAIRDGYRRAGFPPDACLADIACARRYYDNPNPLPLSVERDIAAEVELVGNAKRRFSRRKSSRGLYLILQVACPEDKYPKVFQAFLEAARWRPGQGNKANLQLLDDLMGLFLDLEREGLPLPRTHVNQALYDDGRIVAIFEKHGIVPSGAARSLLSNKAKRYCTLVVDKIIPAVRQALA